MKKLLFITAIYIVSISCVKKNSKTPMSSETSVDTGFTSQAMKTYLALGDSYTIGESIQEQGRYPEQVVNMLRSSNIEIGEPDIIAKTGWTTTDLLNALDDAKPRNNYSIVSLLIGVNNQYQRKSLDDYKIEFTQLLKRSIAFAGGEKQQVFVLSIPDYSVTPFAANLDTAQISEQIEEFNNANKTISLAAGVHYVDITPISIKAKTDDRFTANDGLHPSAYQYKQWSSLLAPIMQAALQ